MSSRTSTQKGLNVGNGVGLYKTLSGGTSIYKTLSGGTNITITGTTDTIIINSSGGGSTNSITGATNGLSPTGDNRVALGGSLTGDTTITTESGYTLNFNNVNLLLDSDSFFKYEKNSGIDKILRSDALGNASWMDLPMDNALNALTLTNAGTVLFGGDVIQETNVDLNGNIIKFTNQAPPFNTGTGFNDIVHRIVEQEDGKFVLIGDFTLYSGNTYNYIIRLNPDGTIDDSFNIGSGFNTGPRGLDIQKDGKIVVGGGFSSYSGVTRSGIIRLNTDGSIDYDFENNVNDVRLVYIQDSGKIFVGKDSTSAIVRLNSDGTIDDSFNIGSGFVSTVDFPSVYSISEQQDGKILVAGRFTGYNGTTVGHFLRLFDDGSLDTDFHNTIGSGFDERTRITLQQPDGKILVGGSFDNFNGNPASGIIRLNIDGTVDNDDFDSGSGFSGGTFPSVGVRDIELQENGQIVAVGFFTSYNGTTANNIIRINLDGSIDPDFTSGDGFNSNTYDLLVNKSGKFLVVGQFTEYSGVTANRIVRLDYYGNIDNILADSIVTFNGQVIEYGGDYQLNYTDRSLVDKGFVTGYTNGNFVTLTGNQIIEDNKTFQDDTYFQKNIRIYEGTNVKYGDIKNYNNGSLLANAHKNNEGVGSLSFIGGGYSSHTGSTSNGGNLYLQGGNQIAITGASNGGNVYIYGGSSESGSQGEIYFGLPYIEVIRISDYGLVVAGTVLMETNIEHGLTDGKQISIDDSPNYNGVYTANVVDDYSFYISTTFLGDEKVTFTKTSGDSGASLKSNFSPNNVVTYSTLNGLLNYTPISSLNVNVDASDVNDLPSAITTTDNYVLTYNTGTTAINYRSRDNFLLSSTNNYYATGAIPWMVATDATRNFEWELDTSSSIGIMTLGNIKIVNYNVVGTPPTGASADNSVIRIKVSTGEFILYSAGAILPKAEITGIKENTSTFRIGLMDVEYLVPGDISSGVALRIGRADLGDFTTGSTYEFSGRSIFQVDPNV